MQWYFGDYLKKLLNREHHIANKSYHVLSTYTRNTLTAWIIANSRIHSVFINEYSYIMYVVKIRFGTFELKWIKKNEFGSLKEFEGINKNWQDSSWIKRLVL